MMSQHRKHRGYASERIVADYLKTHGWPYAEQCGAGRYGTDITGVPGVDWEVKARRGFNVTAAMNQQIARTYDGSLLITVMRPDGYGPERIAQWPAIVPLAHLTVLLHEAGYGDSA